MASKTAVLRWRKCRRCGLISSQHVCFIAMYRIYLQYFPLFLNKYMYAARDNCFHEGYISSMIRGREADVWRAVYCKNF